MEWTSVVRDGTLHRKAAEGANRKGHGHLAGWASVEGEVANRKAGRKIALLDEAVAGCAKPAKAQA